MHTKQPTPVGVSFESGRNQAVLNWFAAKFGTDAVPAAANDSASFHRAYVSHASNAFGLVKPLDQAVTLSAAKHHHLKECLLLLRVSK